MTDVLKEAAEEGTKPEEESVAERVKSALEELVGENKKFKNEEDLAKGKLESDSYINRLHDEAKEARDTIAELQEQLRQAKTQGELDDLRKQIASQNSDKGSEESTPPSLSAEDLESVIEKHLTQREAAASSRANLDKTNEALVEFYGDPEKAAQGVSARAKELGMSVEDLTKVAARSPKAALALVQGGGEPANIDISRTSSVSSESISGTAPKLDKAHFDKMRREDPARYFSPSVQQQIFDLHKEGKYI